MNDFVFGLLFIFLGGFLQGTFAVFFRFSRPLKWEVYWGLYAISGLILAPIVFAVFVTPHLLNALFSLSTQDLSLPVLFGALWGISGIAFGRSLEKTGIAITYTIVLGITMLISTVMSFPSEKLFSPGFFILIFGMLILSAGIIFGILAGIKKYSLSAILPAVLSGIFSPMLTYGFATSRNIAVNASLIGGASKSNAVVLVWLVLLLSSGIMTLLYTAYITGRDNLKTVFRKITLKNLFACILAGVFWFGGFILYSFGPAKLGNFGNAYGWAIFIIISLLAANVWGSLVGEWKNNRKLLKLNLSAVGLIILGIVIVGVGIGK